MFILSNHAACDPASLPHSWSYDLTRQLYGNAVYHTFFFRLGRHSSLEQLRTYVAASLLSTLLWDIIIHSTVWHQSTLKATNLVFFNIRGYPNLFGCKPKSGWRRYSACVYSNWAVHYHNKTLELILSLILSAASYFISIFRGPLISRSRSLTHLKK